MTELKCVLAGTLQGEIKRAKEKLDWMEFIASAEWALQEIADIVRLDILWAEPPDKHSSCLRLAYSRFSDAEEARGDIARIMGLFGIDKLEQQMTGGFSSEPKLYLKAPIVVGDKELELWLRVPWLPKGCTVTREVHRYYAQDVSFYVSCRR